MSWTRFGDDFTALSAVLCGALVASGVTGALVSSLSTTPAVPAATEAPGARSLPLPHRQGEPSAPRVPDAGEVWKLPVPHGEPDTGHRHVVTWAIIREPILMAGPEHEGTGWAPQPAPRDPGR